MRSRKREKETMIEERDEGHEEKRIENERDIRRERERET